MPEYCIHVLDPAGSVRHSIRLLCDDDDEAVRRAEEHDDYADMELWEERRRVARFFRVGRTNSDG